MEPIHSSSSAGSAHHNEDSWTCHRCGWVYPNPHPSAKHRRSHKKHCGKIRGFEVHSHSEQHRNGSSEEASSDDESHAKTASLAHDTPQTLPTASPTALGTTNLGEEKLTNPVVTISKSKDMPVIGFDFPIKENSTRELPHSVSSSPGGLVMQEKVIDKVELSVPDVAVEEVCKQHEKPEGPSGTCSCDLTSFEGDTKTPNITEQVTGDMKTPDIQSDTELSLEAKDGQDPSTKAEQEQDVKSKDVDSQHATSLTFSEVLETSGKAGCVGFTAAEDITGLAANGSRGLDLVLDQAKQAHKPEIAYASSIQGGDVHPHDSWVCHRCGWAYPNPHPSAKHRRNHKKHCGKLKGFELRSERSHQGGSSDEVSSDEESPNRKECLPSQPPELEQQAEVDTNISMGPTTSLSGKISVESEAIEEQDRSLSVSKGDGELISSDVAGISTPDISLGGVPSLQQSAETLPRTNPGTMIDSKSDEWVSEEANQQSSSTGDISVNEEPAAHLLQDPKKDMGVSPVVAVGVDVPAVLEILPNVVHEQIHSPAAALEASADDTPPVEQNGVSYHKVDETRVKDVEHSINQMPDSSGEGECQQSVSTKDTGSEGPIVLENVLNDALLSTPLEEPVVQEGPVVLENVSNDLSLSTHLSVEEKATRGAVPITVADANDLKCDAEEQENINDEVASAASVAPMLPTESALDVLAQRDVTLQREDKPQEISSEIIVQGQQCNALHNQGALEELPSQQLTSNEIDRKLESVVEGVIASARPIHEVEATCDLGTLMPCPPGSKDEIGDAETVKQSGVHGVPASMEEDASKTAVMLEELKPEVDEDKPHEVKAEEASVVRKGEVVPTPMEERSGKKPVIAEELRPKVDEDKPQEVEAEEASVVSKAEGVPTPMEEHIGKTTVIAKELKPEVDEDKPQEVEAEESLVVSKAEGVPTPMEEHTGKTTVIAEELKPEDKPQEVEEALVVSKAEGVPTQMEEHTGKTTVRVVGLKPEVDEDKPQEVEEGLVASNAEGVPTLVSKAEGVPIPMEEHTGKTMEELKLEVDEDKPHELEAEESSVVRNDSDARFASRCDSLEIYEDAQDTLETCSVAGSVEGNEASEGAQEEIKHLDQGTTLTSGRLEEQPCITPDRTIIEEEKCASVPITTYAPKTETQDLRAPSPEAWQEPPGPENVQPVVDNSPKTIPVVTEDAKLVEKKTNTTSEVTEDGKSGDLHMPLRSLMVKEAAEKKDHQVAHADTASGDQRGSNRKTEVARNGTTKSKSRSFWSHCICCRTVH